MNIKGRGRGKEGGTREENYSRNNSFHLGYRHRLAYTRVGACKECQVRQGWIF